MRHWLRTAQDLLAQRSAGENMADLLAAFSSFAVFYLLAAVFVLLEPMS